MFREQSPSPEEMGMKNEDSGEYPDDVKLKNYWNQYSTEELKESLEPDPMGDMQGMTPDQGEFGDDFNPSKHNKEIVKEILKERGEKVD